ncbi:MAG: hypothetical protein P4L86_07435, partial [Mycobacterium sp.]|nr:hypothetical protein [Mycobacterium sp.]
LVVRNNIAAAAANNDSAGIQRACESGQVIVPRVQEHLPSPDSALNTALQQTLDDYRFGFNECLVGVRYQDPAGIELAAVYLHRANEDLRVAMEVIARDLDDVESTDSAVVPV